VIPIRFEDERFVAAAVLAAWLGANGSWVLFGVGCEQSAGSGKLLCRQPSRVRIQLTTRYSVTRMAYLP